MGAGKANLPMSHEKQSEEAVVHRAVAMDTDDSGTQDAHNHVATPNSIEEAVVRDAATVAKLVDDAIMEEEEEEDLDDITHFVQDNIEHLGAVAMELLRRDLPGNTVTMAAAPRAAVMAGQGVDRFDGLLFEDDDYEEYIAMVQAEAERDEARLVPMQTRTPAPAMARARATAPANDPANSTMQVRFTSAQSQAVFASMEEEDVNEWYESIARDAEMMEQMEDPGLHGMSSPLHLPEYEVHDDHRPPPKEDSSELSLQDICKIWGLHQSELGPNEPGPSTKRARVAPLTDDEVAKFDCAICMETLTIFDIFHGMPCPHKFCVHCMVTYIEGKVRDGEVPIPCPNPACKEEGGGFLHPEDCKKSIDFAAFCSWNQKLAEDVIPANQRVYCLNRKCRMMLESTCADKTPSKASCPACKRMMCTTCGQKWRINGSGQHDCAEGPEAEAVMRLATERWWKQCPRCRILVERTMGCATITCRCRAVFCYTCGLLMLPVPDEEMEMCRCRSLNVHPGPVRQE